MLKRILLLSVLLFILFTIVIAAPSSASPDGAVPIDSPKNRIVRTNLNGASSTSDPYSHALLNDSIWQGNVFEGLFYFNRKTGLHEPRVGKAYKISDDGLRYTIEINDNVYFHNGDHVTSQSVKDAIAYAKNNPYNTIYSGDIDRVEIIDDYNFVIVLKKPNASFLIGSDSIYIINTKIVEEQGAEFGSKVNLAGTGPYYIDYYDPAVEIRLLRNDKYYRLQPQIPGINYRVMTDASATLMAFEAGELDFLESMPVINYAELEASRKYNTTLGDTTQVNFATVNAGASEALADPLVRKAMAYALDYESILIGSHEGYGICRGKYFTPWMQAAPTEEGVIYTYDPERAKALLAEAGYPDGGVDVGKILTIAGTYQEKIAQIMQANFADAGIQSTVEPMEQVTAIASMFAGNFGIGVVNWTYVLDFHYTGMGFRPSNDAAAVVKTKNIPGFDVARLEELYDLGISVVDVEKRKQYYTESDRMIMDAACILPLFHTKLPYAWDKNLVLNLDTKSQTYNYTQMYDAYWKE